MILNPNKSNYHTHMHVRELQEISVPELDKYIIIDTHGGVEDVLGIAVALKLAERYDKIILGITCVNGRRTVDQAVHDALVAQQIVGTKIPVYRGSQQSLLLRTDYPVCHDLEDHSRELDQIAVTAESQELVQKDYAPVFIAEQIEKYSMQLCIITFGPLTNIALAYHRIQDIKVLSSIRVTGGASTGVGNVVNSSGSEGNFHYDPESAHIVITNYNNIYLNPIEKVLETSWEAFFKELKQLGRGNVLLDSVLTILLSKKYVLCGPLLTIMPAFLRQTVQKVHHVYCEVMNRGHNIIGLLAPNWLRLDVKEHEQEPNVKLYSDFNLKEIESVVKLAMFS